MKRLLLIPLLALPLLFVSCDGQMPNEPASLADEPASLADDGALFGMAATGKTQVIVRCAKNVSGGIYYQLFGASGALSDITYRPCGSKWKHWTEPNVTTTVNVRFVLTGGSGTCDQATGVSHPIPVRVKCPTSKKADGVAVFKHSRY